MYSKFIFIFSVVVFVEIFNKFSELRSRVPEFQTKLSKFFQCCVIHWYFIDYFFDVIHFILRIFGFRHGFFECMNPFVNFLEHWLEGFALVDEVFQFLNDGCELFDLAVTFVVDFFQNIVEVCSRVRCYHSN
uniref:Uncharacterized protein n=1 Tax=Cacopsylla melanoneura TaxID=428564 RepID=A0A8D9FHM5_9HEMI